MLIWSRIFFSALWQHQLQNQYSKTSQNSSNFVYKCIKKWLKMFTEADKPKSIWDQKLFLISILIKKCNMQMLRILSVPKNFVLFIRKRWRPHWFPKKCCLQPTKKLENIQIYIHTHDVNLLLNKMFSSLKFKSYMINACTYTYGHFFYFDIKFRDLTYFLIRNRVVRNLTLKVLALNFSLAYYFVSLYGLRPKKNSQ